MKKEAVGYIYSDKKFGKDEKLFLKQSKKKNIKLVMINLLDEFDLKKIQDKLKDCKFVFNNSAEEFAFEMVKTIEELGKIVIDSSEAYYYDEDKWMFFLKCNKFKIPSLDTVLLSENINLAREEIKKFNHWPLIIKRVCGTNGDYVEKASNLEESEKIIKKFWKKGGEKLPIIIQEFVKSSSYRITSLEGKIIQTALKESRGGWKATGVYRKKFKKFKADEELKQIAKRIFQKIKIHFCGIDLMKKDDKWKVIEINSTPAFDFFENEREKMIGLVLNYIKKRIKNQT